MAGMTRRPPHFSQGLVELVLPFEEAGLASLTITPQTS